MGRKVQLSPEPPEHRKKSLISLEEYAMGLYHRCGALDEETTALLQ